MQKARRVHRSIERRGPITREHQVVGTRRVRRDPGTSRAEEHGGGQRARRGLGNLAEKHQTQRVQDGLGLLPRIQTAPSARMRASSRIIT